MARGPRKLQVSFAGGEMSPKMYSRQDDPRFRSGAARMRNFVSDPQGSTSRRPGFGLVRETKDSNYRSRLVEFEYSIDDTYAIEMGRADVDGRNIGYFRFHTEGGTLLYEQPRDYVYSETITNCASSSTDDLTISGTAGSGTQHNFQTGDPVVLTAKATGVRFKADFTTGSADITVTGHDFNVEDTIIFLSTNLPPQITEKKTYYIVAASAGTTLQISNARGGPAIVFTFSGSITDKPIACLARPNFPNGSSTPYNLEVNQTIYAINVSSSGPPLIKLAPTKADALAGNYFDWPDGLDGTLDDNDFRVHYDYRQGALVYGAEIGTPPHHPYYLFKPTHWGSPNSRIVFSEDHDSHGPDQTNYWYEMPGSLHVTDAAATAAGAFVIGEWYEITTVGTTDFTLIGSPNNTVGTEFQATGVGAGTGTATGGLVIDPLTDRVGVRAHGLSEGDPITFSTAGTLPVEITSGVVYYVRNPNTNDFQLATTPVGPVLNFTTFSTGVHTAWAGAIYEVPHFYTEDAMFEITTAQSGDILTIAHIDRYASELRRRGVTDWVLKAVSFNAQVDPPTNLVVSVDPGVGDRPTDTRLGALSTDPDFLIFPTEDVGFAPGDIVTAVNIEDVTPPPVCLPDGTYIVEKVEAAAPAVTYPNSTQASFKDVDTGARVALTDLAGGTMSSLARIRTTLPFTDDEDVYAVTALDGNNEESAASEPVTVTSNLLVNKAMNTLTWDAVPGATRYRAYREVNGLFGFIGEVDAPNTTFVDDNIDPDLSITPPIEDEGLRQVLVVDDFLFSGLPSGGHYIEIADHGLEAGAPVIFTNNGTASVGLPTGIEENVTYYVFNPDENSFQIVATPNGTTPIDLGGTFGGRSVIETGDFPSATGYFEQRRVFAGSRLDPQGFWLTASSTETDLTYSIPTRDADRISNRLAARKRSAIRHVASLGNLVFLTSAAEFRVTPLNGLALTPTSVSARAPTHIGARQVEPVLVNDTAVFAANRGGHVREMGYSDDVDDYITGDLSLRANHLFDDFTIVQLTYQQAPQPTVWAVSSRGTLVAMTYVPEEQVIGWHEHDTNGLFESCIAVREGEEDRRYVITNRGGTRYVERSGSQYTVATKDVFYVDFGVTYDDATTPTSTIFVPHLASESVIYLADGVEGSGTVSAAGVLTLTDEDGNTISVNTVHVGLAYTGELWTIPLGMQIDQAFGSGRHWNINKTWVRVYESGSFRVGPSLTSMSDSEEPPEGTLDSKHIEVTIDGEWKLDGQLYITQSGALPLTVAGLTYEVEPGA